MEIRIADGKIAAGSLLRLIATGYALGGGVLLVPALLLLMSIEMLSWGSDEVGIITFAAILVLLPFVLIFQGLIIGVLVLLGLNVYKTRGPIRIANDNGAP